MQKDEKKTLISISKDVLLFNVVCFLATIFPGHSSITALKIPKVLAKLKVLRRQSRRFVGCASREPLVTSGLS